MPAKLTRAQMIEKLMSLHPGVKVRWQGKTYIVMSVEDCGGKLCRRDVSWLEEGKDDTYYIPGKFLYRLPSIRPAMVQDILSYLQYIRLPARAHSRKDRTVCRCNVGVLVQLLDDATSLRRLSLFIHDFSYKKACSYICNREIAGSISITRISRFLFFLSTFRYNTCLLQHFQRLSLIFLVAFAP
jgi:hypothetical protein